MNRLDVLVDVLLLEVSLTDGTALTTSVDAGVVDVLDAHYGPRGDARTNDSFQLDPFRMGDENILAGRLWKHESPAIKHDFGKIGKHRRLSEHLVAWTRRPLCCRQYPAWWAVSRNCGVRCGNDYLPRHTASVEGERLVNVAQGRL